MQEPKEESYSSISPPLEVQQAKVVAQQAKVEAQQRRYAGALEHLKAFIDHTLEAFQVGTGIRNSAPEPMTLDVARRLIWAELTRVFGTLDAANWSGQYLWARLQVPDADGLSKILAAIDTAPNIGGVSFRAYGSRSADIDNPDPTVVYACFRLADPEPTPGSVKPDWFSGAESGVAPTEIATRPTTVSMAQMLLKHLWAAGITTRDVVLGTNA